MDVRRQNSALSSELTIRLAALGLQSGIALRTDKVVVVATRVRALDVAVVHVRSLPNGRLSRYCQRLAFLSSAVACWRDTIAWWSAHRIQRAQIQLHRGEPPNFWAAFSLPGICFSFLYLSVALVLGAWVRSSFLCATQLTWREGLAVMFPLTMMHVALLICCTRLPSLKRGLAYQRALEEGLWAWRSKRGQPRLFANLSSLCWAGPRCFFEASLGGLFLTETCETLMRLTAYDAKMLTTQFCARLALALTFAVQWSMVLCLFRRGQPHAPTRSFSLMGLTPDPPEGAVSLVALALQRLASGAATSHEVPATQMGWPSLAGAPFRERITTCSTNWWRSKPDSRNSTAA